jgi:hypothetical protein
MESDARNFNEAKKHIDCREAVGEVIGVGVWDEVAREGRSTTQGAIG